MQLNKHDIERLVAENQEESKTLEFKAGLYEDSRDGTKEFLKDVTAFANAQGGKLLIGIEEIKGADGFMVASSANGVAVSLDQFKQKWENKLRDITATHHSIRLPYTRWMASRKDDALSYLTCLGVGLARTE